MIDPEFEGEEIEIQRKRKEDIVRRDRKNRKDIGGRDAGAEAERQ